MFTEAQKEVRRLRAKAWGAAHKDRAKRNAQLWNAANKERVRLNHQLYMSSPEAKQAAIASQNAFHDRNPWYNAWLGAKRRCTDPKVPPYRYYGARGIQFHLTQEEVKELWNRDNAIGMKRPSIDRIDPDGHYVFDNCRFIELSENSRRNVPRSIEARKRKQLVKLAMVAAWCRTI